MSLPLEGKLVLEFSQYLAGPYAGLRLADLGARVIKIERPNGGDACRQLATKNLRADGDSVLFHTINRNKESFSADLKDPTDLKQVIKLISKADVITHNFRPGIMQRLGLDYDSVKALNPTIIYAEVSGYGTTGPWVKKPGQDLLAQSMSGLTWLTGDHDMPPTPFGIAVADMLCGTHLVQGILAALVRQKRHNIGAKIEVSLMESMIDFQFEGLTVFLNNDQQLPQRSKVANAHAYLGAPYGIYKTKDGFIAISMGSLTKLAHLINCPALIQYDYSNVQFEQRDLIKQILAEHLVQQSTVEWLALLEPADYWCSDVFDYDKLTDSEAYKLLEMSLTVSRDNGTQITTTRCPIRLNGQKLTSPKAAPRIGDANGYLFEELNLC